MDVTSRKMPRQARAKATFDAIVEATAQLLLKEGYDHFTTARAAERAGVSIGTLYQYFPNKAALAFAVIERCCDDFLIAFDHALAERRPATLAECIDAIVEVGLISHHLTPELHRIVLDLTSHLGVSHRTEQVSRAAASAIEGALRKYRDEIAPDIDIAVAATVIETILEALAHRAISAHPTHVEGDVLAQEATRLIKGYLASDG